MNEAQETRTMSPETAYATGLLTGSLLRAKDYLDTHIESVEPMVDGPSWTNCITLQIGGVRMLVRVEAVTPGVGPS